MSNTGVQVSVVVPTYNHENYIEQAIRSILMQKINFKIEVFIGEDCSTDRTKNVLKKLECDLPSYFHIIYRKKNMNGGNFEDLFARMTGKYFIILEGDDYWTYDEKLQKEYDFLETHPEYTAVAHNVSVVNQFGNYINWRIHECKKEEYTIKDFRKGLFPGQTASVLRRNYFYYNLFDYNISVPEGTPGDRVKAFLMVANGKVYCFQEKWSAYRLVLHGGSSFSANAKYNYMNKLQYYQGLMEYAIRNRQFQKKDVLKVTEEMYFWYLFGCMMKRKCGITLSTYVDSFKKVSFKGKVFCYILLQLFMLPFNKVYHKFYLVLREKRIQKSFLNIR